MIRADSILSDTLLCIHRLVKSLNGSEPWSRWNYYPDYPAQVIKQGEPCVIYFETPRFDSGNSFNQMGGEKSDDMIMTIGAWVDSLEGGKGEIELIVSKLYNFFNSQATVNTTQFTVVLGSTTYTNKTLLQLGLAVNDVSSPQEIATEKLLEFRYSLDINISRR